MYYITTVSKQVHDKQTGKTFRLPPGVVLGETVSVEELMAGLDAASEERESRKSEQKSGKVAHCMRSLSGYYDGETTAYSLWPQPPS